MIQIHRENPKKRFPREKINSWFIIQNNSNTVAEELVSSKNITLPHSDDIIAANDRRSIPCLTFLKLFKNFLEAFLFQEQTFQ